MNASLPRVEGQLGIALALSIALHAILLTAMVLIQDPPAPNVVSAINVRLSTSVLPTPQAISTNPEVARPLSDPYVEPLPEPRELEQPKAEPPQTTVPAAVTQDTQQALRIDAASLQAFIGSSSELPPPSLDREIDVAEQYRRQWHRRVQRIGQLNYPEAASRMKLSGQLTLQVAINTDGSLRSVGIAQSSGHDELDLAALEIVRQASPYEPLPPNLPRSNGQFRFDSTWEFRR